MDIKAIFNRLLNHEELKREETKELLIAITRGELNDAEIAALLTAIQMRGISVEELLGFRDGILATGVPVPLDCDRYIDVVGTGGDRKNTFNISTTACFVIAGAGYKVAKHGNYAATSVSGASNVIKNHGVNFTADLDKLNRSINECGIVYLHAQLFAKAMKFVGAIRKALPFPTFFNLLGPIINPSKPQCQLLGVANLDQMRLYQQVYQKIGIDYGIVNSIDGYDEISMSASSNPPNSASTSPNRRRYRQVPLRKRLRGSSTTYWPTQHCPHRKTSCSPTLPSAYKSMRKARKRLRSA